jgi:hypothetical protein
MARIFSNIQTQTGRTVRWQSVGTINQTLDRYIDNGGDASQLWHVEVVQPNSGNHEIFDSEGEALESLQTKHEGELFGLLETHKNRRTFLSRWERVNIYPHDEPRRQRDIRRRYDTALANATAKWTPKMAAIYPDMDSPLALALTNEEFRRVHLRYQQEQSHA